MAKNTEKVKGYKINFSNNTITVNHKFFKKTQDITTDEYKFLKALKEELPGFSIVVQSGRKVTKTQKNKRFTYENMLRHMRTYKNSDDLIEMFETVKELSMPLASPYKYVCDWFKAQFPNYKDCMASLESTGKSVPVVSAPSLEKYAQKETLYA